MTKFLGLKLVRAERSFSMKKTAGKNSLIVEFIGAPGVGKSTLCDYYLKNHAHPFKRKILTRKDLNKYSPFFELDGVHNQILNIKLKHDAAIEDVSASAKLKRILNFKVFVDHDYLIRHYLQDQIIFLDEERLLIYFLNMDNGITEKERDDYFKNRVFVFCDAPAEVVLNHIKKRATKGRLIERHRNLSDTELLANIEARRGTITERYKRLTALGVKVIKLDISEGLQNNKNLLDKYLEKKI